MADQIFDNSFQDGSEDMLTALTILDNCVDKEKKSEFFKSVLPHTILEQKFEKLLEMSKALKAEPVKTEVAPVVTASKTFAEGFEAAGK